MIGFSTLILIFANIYKLALITTHFHEINERVVTDKPFMMKFFAACFGYFFVAALYLVRLEHYMAQ